MLRSLWIKFLVLLFAVSIIALSAALLLRELMIRDFRAYREGEQEDRVSWITADLESSYESAGRWMPDTARRDAVWSLMLGFEMRLRDAAGRTVVDTDLALRSLPPRTRQRIEALSARRIDAAPGPYTPYPLFSGDAEIGSLEVRFFTPGRETLFIERSNTFLLSALAILGGIAVVLSIVVAGKLTRPLKKITAAAAAISEGELSKRVEIAGRDELARLSEAFNRMAQALEIQDSLRKKLISNVAHELRTPLTAVRGEIEAMLDGLIRTDREQLQSIYDETGRLTSLLDGMDELTRAQASGLTLKKRPIAMKAFLAGIIERFAKTAPERTVTLDCDGEITALADPDRLGQIVINLVSNAVKAVGPGGKVTVACRREASTFALDVSDTGRGIAKADLPFIFERFYRASEGGLGIGLAIVRELVDAHGGTITVTSEEGRGSLFTVRLPG